MATELPEDIAEKLAALGEPIAQFALSGRRLALIAILAPFALVIGALLMMLPFAPLFGWGRQPIHVHLILLGVLLVVAPAAVLVRAWQNRGLRVLVYPEGLIRLRRAESTAFFWHEITTVWRKPSEGHWEKAVKGSVVYKICRANSQEIQFDDQVTDIKKLGEIIERETLPYLLPRAQEACAACGTVHFGKIGVSWEGLAYGKQSAPWSQLKEIKVEGNKLVVRREGKWLAWSSISVADVPNVHVFRALAEQFLGVQGKGQMIG